MTYKKDEPEWMKGLTAEERADLDEAEDRRAAVVAEASALRRRMMKRAQARLRRKTPDRDTA